MKGWSFADTLLKWHELNPREMPWLETKDPYKIWISEIILQQTRVGQGWQYYEKFISRFPDLKTLHESEESEILKYWEGLGYYTRARNIKKSCNTYFFRFQRFFSCTISGYFVPSWYRPIYCFCNRRFCLRPALSCT